MNEIAPSAPETRVGPLVYPPRDLHFEAVVIDYALADEIRYREVAERLRFRDWNFVVERRGAAVFLRVEFDEYDHVYDERVTVKRQRGRDWYLRAGLTESEVVLTAWAAVEMAVVHEAREQFTYSLIGRPTADPRPARGRPRAPPHRPQGRLQLAAGADHVKLLSWRSHRHRVAQWKGEDTGPAEPPA